MRRCLNRWRGRAALLMVLCAFAAPVVAGPDDGATKQEKKIPEVEEAGKLVLQGKLDEAYKLLQTIKEKQDLPPTRLMMARLIMAGSQRVRELQPRVRPYLELAISENVDHPVCYLDNARFALAEGRVTDAILNSEKALAMGAANPTRWTAEQKKEVEIQARNTLAEAYENRADWASAKSQLSAMLAKEKDAKVTAPLHFRLARALFFLDKPVDAFEELNTASKEDKDKKLDTPDVMMAKLWSSKGDNKEARERFEKAVKSDDKNLRVHIAYADWLMQQNDFQLAKLHIDAAAKISSTDPEVQKFQALILRINKDLPASEEIFNKLLFANPDDNFARNHVALVQIDEGTEGKGNEAKQKLAVQNAELHAKANQKSPDALATLGYVYYKMKRVDEALQVLESSLKASNGQISPDTAYYWALCLQDRDHEKAAQILKEAATAKGLFVYKREAQDLRDKLDKMPPKSSTSSK